MIKMLKDDKQMRTSYRNDTELQPTGIMTKLGWKRATGIIKFTGMISSYKNDNELQR